MGTGDALPTIGTLTEALGVMKTAKDAGFLTIVSARSGETEDSTIADIDVTTYARQIKIGSITRLKSLERINSSPSSDVMGNA